jgi:hypothetical protein
MKNEGKEDGRNVVVIIVSMMMLLMMIMGTEDGN